MKNKKRIAMAMVTVSTLTTVVPIFANSVETKTINDVRVASGKALKESGKVYTRTDIYNTKGTKDRSDDTLKTSFKYPKALSFNDKKLYFLGLTSVSSLVLLILFLFKLTGLNLLTISFL